MEEEDDVDVRDWFTVKAQSHLMKAIEQSPSASREAMRQQMLAVKDLERAEESHSVRLLLTAALALSPVARGGAQGG